MGYKVACSLLLSVWQYKWFLALLAQTRSYLPIGLDACPVAVEVHSGRGLPGLAIVGLPDRAVTEAKERVRSALATSGFALPSKRFTVNLAPADLRKEGGAFDLPIALGLLAASGHVDPLALADVAAVGELALDGALRPVPGALSIALALRGQPVRLLVPAAHAAELGYVAGLNLLPAATLLEAVGVISGVQPAAPLPSPPSLPLDQYEVDLAEVRGQSYVKRALEVAAAGGHHLLLVGPPGSGKSMLAQRLPTILPPLTLAEALEATAIHSLTGALNGRPILRQRPFRAPHHTSSSIALVGGGSVPRPGELSLAHHGVLFLDELPEFHRDALEALRQPLEEGAVRIARARRSLSFPARFMLVAAMNPCPCGHLTDPRRRCRCPSTKVASYLAKISGPLLDRIDLHIDVPAVPFDALTRAPEGESSAAIRARVHRAIAFRRTRGQQLSNSQLRTKDLKTHCQMTSDVIALLKSAMQELNLSARSYTKVLKIARTIADLAQQDTLQPEHVAEAIQYRSLDRQWWG